jgi:CheY-like chemotaxis protein
VINEDKMFSKHISNYRPGKYALISVADTGMGMSQETAEKIFEPFFTTKEEGKGTGLGLSIVHGVITQHSGHIEVQSEPGHGTIFRMYLPLAAYKRERARVPATHRSQGGSETVLVAEDNEPVRILVRNILSEYGYTVVESGDGEEAVEKFRDRVNHVHLLLLDVILPKIDGKSVYEEIRKIKPDIKVVFMSGYTTDIVQNHGIFENEFNFIQKPVMPHVLLSKIRNVLDTN